MNTKVRMYVVSAAVIAALAGCGSEAQGGAAGHPTQTHPACPEGSAYPPGTAGEVDYTDSIWHDSVSYEYLSSVHVTAAQIGSVLTRIQCSMATYPDTHAPPPTWRTTPPRPCQPERRCTRARGSRRGAASRRT